MMSRTLSPPFPRDLQKSSPTLFVFSENVTRIYIVRSDPARSFGFHDTVAGGAVSPSRVILFSPPFGVIGFYLGRRMRARITRPSPPSFGSQDFDLLGSSFSFDEAGLQFTRVQTGL